MKRVGTDIGGTFTDLVWLDEETGVIGTVKSLSTPNPADGLSNAIARAGIDAHEISLFMHATTLITNLIVERHGARVGLVTTKGFRDVLEIQTGLRPNPFDLNWQRTRPLIPRWLRTEISERIDFRGNVLIEPTDGDISAVVQGLVTAGIDALAVCLLHSYANPINERRVASVVKAKWPTLPVSLSCEVDSRIREYPRLSTTVVNAFALPKFAAYVSELDRRVNIQSGIKFMQSSGGVTDAAVAARTPASLIYSGPVGGVLAARALSRQVSGLDHVITVDMGGTSFDVCVVEHGEAEEADEIFVDWAIPVRTHTIDIHTVGAGGGSIARRDAGGALTVGPESAGSNPGPACYGLGGTEPTVTDANLVLGLLRPESFARNRGQIEITPDHARAQSALRGLADKFGVSTTALAKEVFRSINSTMAQAIREVTVFKGFDPRGRTLIAYGGCGPQHAVEVAREIGIRKVLVPRMPSVFSAAGLLAADLILSAASTVLAEVSVLDMTAVTQVVADLESKTVDALRGEPAVKDVATRRDAYMRYVGQSHELRIPFDTKSTREELISAFEVIHHRKYGTRLGDPVELVDVRVTAYGTVGQVSMKPWGSGSRTPTMNAVQSTAFGSTTVYERSELASDFRFAGPALVEEDASTTYVPEGAEAAIDHFGNILIEA